MEQLILLNQIIIHLLTDSSHLHEILHHRFAFMDRFSEWLLVNRIIDWILPKQSDQIILAEITLNSTPEYLDSDGGWSYSKES